jgi:hypothetical protein
MNDRINGIDGSRFGELGACVKRARQCRIDWNVELSKFDFV